MNQIEQCSAESQASLVVGSRVWGGVSRVMYVMRVVQKGPWDHRGEEGKGGMET